MKVSELSRRASVPLPTVKFYLRTGLLPSGERTGVNQSEYGEAHLRRLAAIRALRDIGGLSVEQIADVLRAIDDPALCVRDVLAQSSDAMLARPRGETAPEDAPAFDAALSEIDQVFTTLDWRVRPGSQTRRQLAETLLALRRTGFPGLPAGAFLEYAHHVEPIARMEIDYFHDAATGSREQVVESSVVGTVLWERVITALRRAAHESLVSRIPEFSEPPAP